jgi:hypothetical protein
MDGDEIRAIIEQRAEQYSDDRLSWLTETERTTIRTELSALLSLIPPEPGFSFDTYQSPRESAHQAFVMADAMNRQKAAEIQASPSLLTAEGVAPTDCREGESGTISLPDDQPETETTDCE